MPNANLKTVRIGKPPTTSFGQTMNEVRQWLDHHKIKPTVFKPLSEPNGFGFELSFRTEEEALLFKRDFH